MKERWWDRRKRERRQDQLGPSLKPVQEPKPKPYIRLSGEQRRHVIDTMTSIVLPKYRRLLQTDPVVTSQEYQEIQNLDDRIVLKWGPQLRPNPQDVDSAIAEFQAALPNDTSVEIGPLILENYAYISYYIEPESNTVEVLSDETVGTWLGIPELLNDHDLLDPMLSRAIINPLPGFRVCILSAEMIEDARLRKIPGWDHRELVVLERSWANVSSLKEPMVLGKTERVLL